MSSSELQEPVSDEVERTSDGVPNARSSRTRRPRLLVLGIGNLLRADDGVGVHAVNAIRKTRRHCGVRIVEVGNVLLDAIPHLCWADRVLVIDAVDACERPGTLYFAGFSQMLTGSGRLSLHENDLSFALSLMPAASVRPEIWVLGVQPASLGFGLELSPEVAGAIPKIERFVGEKIFDWRRQWLRAR